MNAEAALRSTVGRWQGPRLAIYEVTEDAGQPSCTVSTTQAQGHTWVAPSAVRLAGGGRVLWSGSFVLDPGESSDTTICRGGLLLRRRGGRRFQLGHRQRRQGRQEPEGAQRPSRAPQPRDPRRVGEQLPAGIQRDGGCRSEESGESTILSLCVDFPALCCSDARSEEASRQYKELRATVDDHWPLQAGMVVSTSDGLIPKGVWNYNFFFDEEVHKHNESSLSTLRVSGVDVARHKLEGIDAVAFGQNLGNSVLVGQYGCTPWWLTFSGSYHFGFLLKVLTKGRPLPEEVGSFLGAAPSVFCPLRYDLREQLPWDSLDALAGRHGVQRHGPHWQAGSNALLSLELYMRITPGLWGGGGGTLRPDPLPDPAQLLAWAPTPPGQWHPPPPEAPPAPEPEGLGRGGRAKVHAGSCPRVPGSSRLEVVGRVASIPRGLPASGCFPAAAPRRERSGAAWILPGGRRGSRAVAREPGGNVRPKKCDDRGQDVAGSCRDPCWPSTIGVDGS
ncbi:unnamed protein product [Prorocentrum cordatum]|uniref:Uncharacterized protein n=1 Tax=Prorocentrum cordatum TaxID=2364126 RepID=A0ABN9SCX4_9DINO|nr:unnamed protein product [Polarella glacialis]